MKPKTKIQKEVARLSANLRPISATQIDWAYRHCVEHIGYRTKKGNITCSDCGHEWHSDSGLCDTLEGCTCPKCHAELKVQDTRRRIYKETQNFSVITTCKGYQVIRVAQVRCESRKGEPMRFYCHEVVQRWISPDGKVTDMALLRGFLFCYCDVWALGSDMEVRPHNSLYDDVVARSCAYPKMRILPQLRRNGFKGDFHGISPVRLFKALLSDPRIETLMKGGEIEVMKHFLFNTRTADECWASYLIAKRHKYQIDNLSMCIRATVKNTAYSESLWKKIDEFTVRYREMYTTDSIKDMVTIHATREAYKKCGKDPSRYRPSGEALCRRILRGIPLYQIDTLVDLINLVSIRYGYSIGGFDADKIQGDTLVLGIGKSGEPYEGIGRGELNIEGMPVYRDAMGGIGTPTSDNERTKLEAGTTHLLTIINGYSGKEGLQEAADYMLELLKEFAASKDEELIYF